MTAPALLLGLAGLLAAGAAQADLLRHCAAARPLDAAQHDRLFRISAVVRGVLDQSGQRLALIARAGTDLQRFGQRYSHAGISLLASPNTPWSVRQLYYDCDLAQPRIFDQGLPGFLLGGADPDQGHTVLLLLPEPAARPLEAAALDTRQALRVLGSTYSANAHAFSTRYQNCNQWVAELLAQAWGGLAGDGTDARAQAQQWLQQQGYAPTPMQVGNPLLLLAGAIVPWLHTDDHPAEGLRAQRFDVSMPASIESFVRQRVQGVQRIEFCHDAHKLVVRRGWTPIADGCEPAAGDRVIPLGPAAVPASGA
ncbi:MAG: DUF2145 domain-containing protein [Aquabacterium sp.]|nr:DUF2145 domain-containing protein [Aquabacterium sp.]